MRKVIPTFVLLIVLLSLVLPFPALASGKIMSPPMQNEQLQNVFSLAQLGYAGKLMIGPYDSSGLHFSLPANIRLAPGSTLFLQFALAWSGGTTSEGELPGVGGTLLVYFNDELIETIVLTPDAPLEWEISIPDSALNNVDETGRYNLRFFLNAGLNCDANAGSTTLIVDKNSELDFQYEVAAPLADLTLFPRPIYQPDSILPSSALIVVPDSPEPYELEAAIAAMTGMGAVTNGRLNVQLITNSALSLDLVSNHHLIFVGLARNFPNLEVVNFPAPLANGRLQFGQGFDSDGVIEISSSPWSPENVVMFVGGNSQEAVTKAGRAFSTGGLVAVEIPGLSVIKSVNPLASVPIQEDQSFKDLGYDDVTLGIYDEYYAVYDFYASPEQAVSEGAYLDMVISHSNLIDYDQTGMTLILNDEVIGGLKLSEESPTTERIKLVPGVVRRGLNRLEIISEILPNYSCYSEDLLSTSVTVSRTSAIHLPVSAAKIDIGKNVDMRDFPYMFLESRDLSNLAFILAPNDPVSWNYASLVAFSIGANGNVPLANVHIMYADNVPEDALEQYNLLVFGLPSAVPFFSKINDHLPAPVNSSTNEAVQPSMLVNYSLLPDTSVGYLQLLPSPWNLDRTILTVSGNTLEGLPMAGSALLRDEQVSKLAGNFAIIYFDQIVSTDTRLGVGRESIVAQLPVAVTATPVVTTTAPQSGDLQIEARPAWILPLVGVVTAGILILLVVMIRRESSASRATSKNSQKPDESPFDSR